MLIWLRFCSWRLVEILRMKFDHDQDRCAFGNVWKQGSHKLQWNFQPGLYLPLYELVEWKFLWKVTLVYWCSIMSKFLCKVTKKDINHAKVVYYGTELDVKLMESNVKSNHFMKVCILVQSICCCLMSQPLFYNFSYPSPYWENNFEIFGKQNILAMATTMTNGRKKKRMKYEKSPIMFPQWRCSGPHDSLRRVPRLMPFLSSLYLDNSIIPNFRWNLNFL